MIKMTKKDYIFLSCLCAGLLVFVLIMKLCGYEWGSPVDWQNQHILFPDYFRKLFYETGDVFVSFAFNLGAGQNIFNFAYYGLFSPVYWLSFILPFVSMKSYVIAAALFGVLLSTVLFYLLLKKLGNSPLQCFVFSLVFLLSAPLIFHTHQHPMFVAFMPFVLISFLTLIRYKETGKVCAFIVSIFLLVLSEFYFALFGIISVMVFWFYLNFKDKIKVKFKDFLRLCLYIINGILLASFLLIPSAYSIIAGRAEASTQSDTALLSLLCPNLSTHIYWTHAIGLGAIFIFAIIFFLFKRQKHSTFLAMVFVILILFPIINYASNGCMYIDGKTFIPLLPLAVILVSDLTKELTENKKKTIISCAVFVIVLALLITMNLSLGLINNNFAITAALDTLLSALAVLFYLKFKKEYIIYSVLISVTFGIFFNSNVTAIRNFISSEEFSQNNPEECEELINKITEENNEDLYRITERINSIDSTNKTYNISHNISSIYSSTFNPDYRKLCYDIFNIEISYNNLTQTNNSANVLYNMYMSNRYLLTKNEHEAGYEKVGEHGEYSLYENDSVLPIGYASDKLMSRAQFESLEYPYNVEALMKFVIIEKSIDEVDFKSNIQKFDIKKIAVINSENLSTQNSENTIHISAEENAKMKLSIADNEGDMLFMRIYLTKQTDSNDNKSITVNSQTNMLSSLGTRYPNNNYVFDYLISDNAPIDTLDLSFTKGDYYIEKIELFAADYSDFCDINKNVDGFIFDSENTKGDSIAGRVNAKNNGILELSIPYDSGFEVKVDGKPAEYEKVDTAFIGIPIAEGEHTLEINYTAPGLAVGLCVSVGAILLFCAVFFITRKKLTEPSNVIQ